MIKIHKHPHMPSSLINTSAYDGEDVKRQLLTDQHNKCYICERSRHTDFEVEHYKSQTNHPDLIQDWANLLMGCGYCNRKKSDTFDNTLNPINCEIEKEIEQRIDFENKRALFKSKENDAQHEETIELLNRIYNGTSRMRKIKEERFFEQALRIINLFLVLVYRYLEDPTPYNENAVRNELAIDKELLGFKYWIIQDNPHLHIIFAKDIIWNK